MAEKHLVKNWRGSRISYNTLKRHNLLDAWTKYYVTEQDGSITEYFGENRVIISTGQFLAVKDILHSSPNSNQINPYDRYLVGNDGEGYSIYEYTPTSSGDTFELSVTPFDWKYGVRVYSRGLKNFVYYDGELKTYDDVDADINIDGGEF